MSKKQSSLFSFFQKPQGTPKASAGDQPKTPQSAKLDEKPVKRNRKVAEEPDENASPMKMPRTAKRRRVVVSSDEEYAGEEEEEDAETPGRALAEGTTSQDFEAATFETPKSCKREVKAQLAESFIASFSYTEHEKGTPSKEMKLSETPFTMIEESEKYEHEKLDFLQPGKRKDADKHPESHPEYNPSTLYVPPEFLAKQSPGHKQWWSLKSRYYDTILLFKVGKFYELYHMDALTAVSSLNIALMRGTYAHAGFPEHAYGKFADQLVARGFKVARIEQTETPQQLEERNLKASGPKEKVVKRELCRVTTVATKTFGVLDGVDLGDASVLTDSTARHLLAIKEEHQDSHSRYGVCTIDTSTGAFEFGEFADDEYRSHLRTFLAHCNVAQVLVERGSLSSATKGILNGMLCTVPTESLIPKKQFYTSEQAVKALSNDDCLGDSVSTWPYALRQILDRDSVLPKPSMANSLAWSALGAVLWYLQQCKIDVDMVTMKKFCYYDERLKQELHSEAGETMWKDRKLVLDGTTLENLNIIPNGRDLQSTSLFNVLNRCCTPFGRRLLRMWLCAPTCDAKELSRRQDAIEWLMSPTAKDFVQKSTGYLRRVPDLERLLQKIHTLGLKYRAEKHPDSRAQMFDASRMNCRKAKELVMTIRGFRACYDLRRLYDEYRLEGEGSEILDECLGIDEMKQSFEESLRYFEDLFDQEQAMKTGKIEPKKFLDEQFENACRQILACEKSIDDYRKEQERKLQCRIVFSGSGRNRYQMDVPDKVVPPKSFAIKGQRKGFRKYMTEELEQLIEELGEAESEREKLAADTTRKVFEHFDEKRDIWDDAFKSMAAFDVILSLSKFASTCGLQVCRPTFDHTSTKPYIKVVEGVHPCLALQSVDGSSFKTSSAFIANDTQLGGECADVLLLTGPNMGGKSTLMRQTAVLCILAHLGSMVPAVEMKLTPVDRIFTRIGANDRIMCGQSTFYVELNEVKVMLRDASEHSLLLIDELGRGTSTFDGTAIASAVLKHLADTTKCRTFFSTHYHSICTTMADNKNVALAHMACVVDNENEEDPTVECVTFLYRLATGVCPKSYGFYAAKLAGISDQVVREAFAASNRFASKLASSTTCDRIARLRAAARDESVSVEQLQQMVAAL